MATFTIELKDLEELAKKMEYEVEVLTKHPEGSYLHQAMDNARASGYLQALLDVNKLLK